MAITNLDERTKEAIDNYGNRIETLKDFVTAVRKLPGMYISSIGNRGFLNMIREVYQNSIDQIKLPTSPCDHIYLYYNEKTLQVTVEDNGMGLPFGDMVRIVTSHHTSANYTKQKGEYSSGRHGSGLKAVNGLSSKCLVESFHYSGAAKRLETKEGYPVSDPIDIPNKEKKQGTRITFFPCLEVLGDLTLEWPKVYQMAKRIISLTPIGSSMTFIADDLRGVRHEEQIVNKDGIITELIAKVKHPIIKPIVFGADTGEMKLDLAFCYDSGTDDGPDPMEYVISFCNMTPTGDGGTHVDGVMDGICRWFTLYMNNIYLNGQSAKNKVKVTSADIKSGLNVIISAAHLYPTFGGQAKDTVTNEDLEPFCKDVVMKGLDEWSKGNPQDLAKLSRYFKDLAEIRQKSETSKAKIVTKYAANPINGLPSKYTAPLGKDHLELLIVEGDSAGGTVKVGRDKNRQGVFPIRGKILNVFQSSKEKAYNNAEIQGILNILFDGKPYKKNFDPIKDVKFEKIIFMTDADVDGAHIAALLLRFFVMYMPQLIHAGKVYKAAPPLYSIKQAKKAQYFVDQLDVTRYIQKHFTQKHTLTHLDKKPLSGKESTVLFMKNNDLVYELERMATTYGVNPHLLEMVLTAMVSNTPISTLKKQIKKKYRFMDVVNVNGVTVVQGTIEASNKIYVTDKLLKDCKMILDILRDNISYQYLLDGEVVSLYTIMKVFENSVPKLQRYKGLGEMDSDEISVSTLLPDSERTLIRYTFESAKEEIEAIRDYESDLSKLLNLVGSVNRADLLD